MNVLEPSRPVRDLYRDYFTFACSNRPTNITPHLTFTLKCCTVALYNHTAPSTTDASSNFQKLHQMLQKLHPTISQHMIKYTSLPSEYNKR